MCPQFAVRSQSGPHGTGRGDLAVTHIVCIYPVWARWGKSGAGTGSYGSCQGHPRQRRRIDAATRRRARRTDAPTNMAVWRRGVACRAAVYWPCRQRTRVSHVAGTLVSLATEASERRPLAVPCPREQVLHVSRWQAVACPLPDDGVPGFEISRPPVSVSHAMGNTSKGAARDGGRRKVVVALATCRASRES